MQQSLVEEYMFKALVLLLEQKPYDKISITEIAKRAGVSRMSYYRNYSSKDEIITKFWEKKFADNLEKMLQKNNNRLYDFVCDYFSKNRYSSKVWERFHFWQHISDSTVVKVLIDQMNHFLYNIFSQVEFLELKWPLSDYEVAFLAGGLSSLSRSWGMDSFQKTPEKMAEIFCQLVLTPDFCKQQQG